MSSGIIDTGIASKRLGMSFFMPRFQLNRDIAYLVWILSHDCVYFCPSATSAAVERANWIVCLPASSMYQLMLLKRNT